MLSTSELNKRIEAISWFRSCGNELTVELKYPFSQLNSWTGVKKAYSTLKWENTRLEVSGDLSIYLLKNYPSKRQEWNLIAEESKNFLYQKVKNKLIVVKEKQQLDQKFLDCVMWDLVHAFIEDAYKDLNPPIFYLELLKIYEIGHFPCGWKGKWPQGELLLF